MRKPRDYHAEYVARVRRAKQQGERNYYELRKKRRKEKLAALASAIPDWATGALQFDDLPPLQQEAVNRLEQYGVSRQEIDPLLTAGPDFWKQARPLLERESELARAH